jgi:hypothetical protein
MLSFAQTGLDLRRPTTDLDPGLVRLINLDRPTVGYLTRVQTSLRQGDDWSLLYRTYSISTTGCHPETL